ncbi:hypothetical protein [Bacillus licheniformis]|uniref:hypothetical protein n=1 Tax=Bacillus licheniformis TaxID=1402 RepID=UPI000AE03DE5|nr:hypothetical protein [Bacillus licheniformis]
MAKFTAEEKYKQPKDILRVLKGINRLPEGESFRQVYSRCGFPNTNTMEMTRLKNPR